MKYKKSIDCNNPKGFSQKAHCQARKLRRKGMKTKSDPIKESVSNEEHYAAIEDVHVNLENRNHAIDEYGYGPLSPKENNEEFWNDKADLWKTTIEEAKKSRCYNCAAFNQTPKVLKAIGDALGPVGNKIVEKADLGFCEFFKFKCAGERTCDAWITNGPLKESILPEDAPANAAGGGNIAGLGVGPQGEPGLKMKQRLKYKRKNAKDVQDREGEIATLVRRAQPVMESKTGVFAGNTTFIVPSDMFHRARLEKRKGKHWKTYIGEDEHGMAIREYAGKNRKKAIILQDENTGAMCYARYGAK